MIDLANLQPHKISRDISSYTSFIYGVPKVGKTTYCHELYGKRGLILAFEKGYGALSGAMAQDITQWSDLATITVQLANPVVKEKFDVLILDTIDLMDKLAERYILEQNGIDNMSDLGYGKAYADKDKLIFDMLTTWLGMGYNLCFIAHSTTKTEKVKDVEVSKYYPSTNNRTLQIVSKMCDFIGFAYLYKSEDGKEDRTLYLRETSRFQAGSRFKCMPTKVPFKAEAFTEELKKAIAKEEEENPNMMKDEKETTIALGEKLDYDKIMTEIVDLVKNKFAPNNKMDVVTSIVENHLGQGAKVTETVPTQVQTCSIILTELTEKIKELGL